VQSQLERWSLLLSMQQQQQIRQQQQQAQVVCCRCCRLVLQQSLRQQQQQWRRLLVLRWLACCGSGSFSLSAITCMQHANVASQMAVAVGSVVQQQPASCSDCIDSSGSSSSSGGKCLCRGCWLAAVQAAVPF
jgi:hypothetical protein